MKAAEEALLNFPANRSVADEHVVARWCGRDITAAHFRLAAEALALIRVEAAKDDPWEALWLIAKRARETSKEEWIDDSSAIHSLAYCALKGVVDPRRAEAAAVPADREALARRLQARADELGTAYADEKAMLARAAATIRNLRDAIAEAEKHPEIGKDPQP
jgi:hypothetical protein